MTCFPVDEIQAGEYQFLPIDTTDRSFSVARMAIKLRLMPRLANGWAEGRGGAERRPFSETTV